jgi:hypothetical protein
MATLNYEDFLKKYVLDSGINQVKESLLNNDGIEDLSFFDMIIESVGESIYKDYLEGKLTYIQEEDKPDNNNK